MDDGDPRYGDHEDSPETEDSAIFIMEEDEVTTIHWKPWPDIHGFTGFKLVTLTWELLENILLFVDEKTLLLAQRVNKYWRSVIQGSPSLRCRLFFEPSRPRTWANIHPNPLLGLVFHNWRVEVQHQMTHLRHTSRQMRSKVLASWHIIAIRWEGFQENHDHKTRGLTSSRPLPSQDAMDLWDPPWPDGPVGRKDASWRRMLACQPVDSWLEGLVAEKMTYRVLDLASQRTWAVTYWHHGEYLAWRSAPMGPAKGSGLGRIGDGGSR
ncbi:hypothetical protein BN1723_010095 [Verticillium longisporum]|uniref:F-box domain-containing protein n=1 Tax=Verticillium longisporum TaxID=100787 RepID=A0A0G4KUY0_VERLO|nr:hypothetical protein BN1723_010095 [Verticillium longisporum]